MKHDILISISVLAALIGCTKVDVRTPEHNQSPVRFNSPVVSNMTKTVLGEMDGDYDEDESFAVFSVYHSDGFNGWGKGISYINRAEFTYNAGVDDDDDGLGGWTGGYYYPKSGSLSFAAYSPFSAHAATPGAGTGTFEYASSGLTITNFTVPALAEQYDLMYSERIYNKTGNGVSDGYEGLDLVFYHALSSIKFQVQKKAAYDGYTITLKGISMQNIKYKGNFSENIDTEKETEEEIPNYDRNPAWTEISGQATYVFFDGSEVLDKYGEDQYEEIGDLKGAILLPQAFAEGNAALIKVDYTIKPTSMPEISQTATIPLNKLSEGWVIGKRYTYNISIGYDTITISPTVIGWENVNGDVAVN